MSVNQRSRTYSWEDPNALRDAGSGMSGLEFIQGVFERKLPPPPIAATMDFTGVVHGGFAMTVLDSALGCAVQTTLVQGEGYTSLETSVNLVRPITKDTGLIAESTGKLLAHGTTACLIFRP